jgi:hypothetical protein
MQSKKIADTAFFLTQTTEHQKLTTYTPIKPTHESL